MSKFIMNKPARRKAKDNYDPGAVDSNTYNDAAGSRKISDVGHHLEPIKINPTSFTCDISTKRLIGKGVVLALYNNDTVVHSVTLGDSTVTSLVAGVANASGQAGIALAPGQYTYVNTYIYDYAISDSANVLAFVVTDDTFMEFRK